MYVFGLIGILSPIFFVLERIYKNTFSNSYKDNIKYINKYLNLLKENAIFS
ncbi:hypothetical protein CLPU_5c02440 [Gottschalkia purinilytica]|uniref:Uncharacterized protein n=1 Tax=Gottschalkia purinilytica TaxID=1503 RepID=A0A0L0WBV0_GOTPU|nr:hypothetical protein CLPU_5c02440 [Gottschalkia purinilytica]